MRKKIFILNWVKILFSSFIILFISIPNISPSPEPDPDVNPSPKIHYEEYDPYAIPPTRSVHGEHMKMLEGIKVELEPEIKEAIERDRLERELGLKKPLVEAVNPSNDPNFIVFGYVQSDVNYFSYHYRWWALTHVGSPFLNFDADGNITNLTAWTTRSSTLRAGGDAEANGVKVVMVVKNQNFDESILDSVMQNASRRTTLVNNIISAVTSDGYCAGVSLDFEFSWGTATRNGITAFIQQLNTDLKALLPPRELSVYVHAIYSSTYWDIPNIASHVDYILYSCYDWATGTTTHAISDINNCIPQVNNYINAGMPPEKIVLTMSAYSRRWSDVTTYNATSPDYGTSQGFVRPLYETSLEPDYSGPYANNYVRGDEIAWYTYSTPTNYVATWDDTEAMEYALRLTKSFQDSGGNNSGRRLRGVGFWSLYWMATSPSYDPISGTQVDRTRTYGQIYQLCSEIFSPPGVVDYLIEKFESLDYRWRDPNESPDTNGDTDNDSYRSILTAPSGAGKPANTTNAMQVYFDFESSSGNKLFFRHEILNDNNDTLITDTNSAKAYFDTTTKIKAYMYVSGSGYSGRQVRMVVMDANRQLEVSNPYSLATPGWSLLEWDLTDSAQINAYTTSEPAFNNGNGILNTAGVGACDIAFIGFIIEGGGAGSGTLYFDELSYTHSNPGGKNYIINELRYNGLSNEFVEIYGPAGAIPAGFQLRVFDSTDGSATTFNISGTIPNDVGGYGFFVVGDPGVPNVDFTTGFSASVDNIPDIDPSGIQLYNSNTGGVYDSVVYEAFGGLDDLIRKETLGVTQNGYPWLGEIASGTNASGELYTMGRYPNGNNSHINFNDFSFMPASPGATNGNTVIIPTTYNFTSAPPKAFQTYQAFLVTNPVSAGLPASPNGGNVHRCVDLSGGGVMTVIGDAALGYDGNGYDVSGEIYIPNSAEPAQAIAVGICGRQGSVFFTSDTYDDANAYETGYWLIFENKSGVGLNDGRPDHPDVFEFVYATNDNMDGQKVSFLDSATRTETGASAGAWTTFYFNINPNATAGNRLIAKINNVDIYRGNIPTGGPISGAFQVGFRENHTGTPASNEGTWIDNISIGSATAVNNWLLY